MPWSGTPVRLGDDDVRLADMNGDGLIDLVRVRFGDVKYWPGDGRGRNRRAQRDRHRHDGHGSRRPAPRYIVS